MALSVNLRADLAKLSDQELADRFERTSEALEQAKRNGPRWGSLGLFSFRGPLRHRRAYRFFSILTGSDGHIGLGAFIALVFSHKKYESYYNTPDYPDLHLSMCEMKDIADELERRVKFRKAHAT